MQTISIVEKMLPQTTMTLWIDPLHFGEVFAANSIVISQLSEANNTMH